MNLNTFALAIATAFIGATQAGYIYIWSPYAATQCQANTTCAISWQNSNDGPQFNRVDIELLNGDANQANVVAPIVLGYDLSQGNTYLWQVPATFPGFSDAFIRIKGVGTDYQSYSHRFSVASASGVIPSNPVTGTVVPTGTATATHTGASTASSTSTSSAKTLTSSTSTSSATTSQVSMTFAAAALIASIAAFVF